MLLDEYRDALTDALFAIRTVTNPDGSVRTEVVKGTGTNGSNNTYSSFNGVSGANKNNFKTDANSMKNMNTAWNKNKNVQATRAFGGNKAGSQFGGHEAASHNRGFSVSDMYMSALADALFAQKIVTDANGNKRVVFTDEKTGKEIKPVSEHNNQGKGYTSNNRDKADLSANGQKKLTESWNAVKNRTTSNRFGGDKNNLYVKHDNYGAIRNHSNPVGYSYLDVMFNDQPQLVQQDPNQQQPQMVQDPNQAPQQNQDQPQMAPQQQPAQNGVANLGDPNANYYPGMRVVDDKGNAGTVRTGNKLMQDSKGQFTGIEVMWDSGKCDWISTQLVGMQVQEIQQDQSQDPNQQQPDQIQDPNQQDQTQQGTQQVNSSLDDKYNWMMSMYDRPFSKLGETGGATYRSEHNDRRNFSANPNFNPYSDSYLEAPGNVGQAIYKSVVTGITDGITKAVADELSVTIPQLFDLGRTSIKHATISSKSGNQAEIALQAQAEIQAQIEKLLSVRSGKVITSDRSLAARKQHLYLN